MTSFANYSMTSDEPKVKRKKYRRRRCTHTTKEEKNTFHGRTIEVLFFSTRFRYFFAFEVEKSDEYKNCRARHSAAKKTQHEMNAVYESAAKRSSYASASDSACLTKQQKTIFSLDIFAWLSKCERHKCNQSAYYSISLQLFGCLCVCRR